MSLVVATGSAIQMWFKSIECIANKSCKENHELEISMLFESQKQHKVFNKIGFVMFLWPYGIGKRNQIKSKTKFVLSLVSGLLLWII